MHRADWRFRWYFRLLLADKRARSRVNVPRGAFISGRPAQFVGGVAGAPPAIMVKPPPPPPPPPPLSIGLPGGIGLPGPGVSF